MLWGCSCTVCGPGHSAAACRGHTAAAVECCCCGLALPLCAPSSLLSAAPAGSPAVRQQQQRCPVALLRQGPGGQATGRRGAHLMHRVHRDVAWGQTPSSLSALCAAFCAAAPALVQRARRSFLMRLRTCCEPCMRAAACPTCWLQLRSFECVFAAPVGLISTLNCSLSKWDATDANPTPQSGVLLLCVGCCA